MDNGETVKELNTSASDFVEKEWKFMKNLIELE